LNIQPTGIQHRRQCCRAALVAFLGEEGGSGKLLLHRQPRRGSLLQAGGLHVIAAGNQRQAQEKDTGQTAGAT